MMERREFLKGAGLVVGLIVVPRFERFYRPLIVPPKPTAFLFVRGYPGYHDAILVDTRKTPLYQVQPALEAAGFHMATRDDVLRAQGALAFMPPRPLEVVHTMPPIAARHFTPSEPGVKDWYSWHAVG